MPSAVNVDAPAGFAPISAIGFGAKGSAATPVDGSNPLPVRTAIMASTATPLAGIAAASATVGPFLPELGRAIFVTLSGSWAGTVQLLRSTDGGATQLPLTYSDASTKARWTGNLNAAVAEESVATASYWLAITLASGTLSYRVEQ